MKKIEIDVAFEEPTELIRFTQDAVLKGLLLKVIAETADYNGGWPVVEVSGDGQTILEFLDAHGFEFQPDDLVDVSN